MLSTLQVAAFCNVKYKSLPAELSVRDKREKYSA